LKALSPRILQGEVPDSDPAAQLTPNDSMSFLPNFEEDIIQNETHASERVILTQRALNDRIFGHG